MNELTETEYLQGLIDRIREAWDDKSKTEIDGLTCIPTGLAEAIDNLLESY